MRGTRVEYGANTLLVVVRVPLLDKKRRYLDKVRVGIRTRFEILLRAGTGALSAERCRYVYSLSMEGLAREGARVYIVIARGGVRLLFYVPAATSMMSRPS